MIDPVEDIADAMVTFLNGDRSGWDHEPSINFTAEKTADPTADLQIEDLNVVWVFVIPFGERVAGKIGRGGQCVEVYSVFLLVVRKVDVDFTRAKLSELARQLNYAIRHEGRIGGYPFSLYDTTAKYELEALRAIGHFANSTRFDFVGIS